MATNGAAEPQPRSPRKTSGKSGGSKQSKASRSSKAANGSAGGNGKAKGNQTPGNPASVRAQVEARGGRNGCLWPIGDPNDSDFHFCGASAQPGKPYCTEHAQRAYITRSRGDRDEEAA